MSLPVRPLSHRAITAYLADVSTAGQIYVVAPSRGRIVRVWSALNGAITGADSILTLKINGTAVTNGTMTVAFTSSAAGDVDVMIPSALNLVQQGDAIEIETDGGSTGTVPVMLTIVIEDF
jgi:hypothetical protein